MYSKKFVIQTSEADHNLNLRLPALFLFMQDVATAHAEELNIGKANTIDKGLYWVITRYSISFNKLPKYLDEINVTTYPGDNMKFIFPRNFLIQNTKGEDLIKASSTWMVLHKDTHKVSLNPFGDKLLPSEHLPEEEPAPKKINPQEVQLIDSRRVRSSDVDINNHLNNTRYIEYIVDCHKQDYFDKKEIKHLSIEYKKEIMIDQQVDIYSSLNNPEYILGKVNDEICFEVEIIYK